MRQSERGDLFVSVNSIMKVLDAVKGDECQSLKAFKRLVSESKVAYAKWIQFQSMEKGDIH